MRVDGQLVFNRMQSMLDAARAGFGLTFLLEDMVQADVAAGRLTRVLADWCPAYPGFFLYYPSRRQLPAALRAFVDFVRACS